MKSIQSSLAVSLIGVAIVLSTVIPASARQVTGPRGSNASGTGVVVPNRQGGYTGNGQGTANGVNGSTANGQGRFQTNGQGTGTYSGSGTATVPNGNSASGTTSGTETYNSSTGTYNGSNTTSVNGSNGGSATCNVQTQAQRGQRGNVNHSCTNSGTSSKKK